MKLPLVPVLETKRLKLIPLKESHAKAMFKVLANEKLYEFTGGKPPESIERLTEKYKFLQSRFSPDKKELWLNWIIFLNKKDPIGYVQATVSEKMISIAWVVGVDFQGFGFATESAKEMVKWLRGNFSTKIIACVNPNHFASQKVAKNIGLKLTNEIIESEEVWTL
ncbi:MAG: N-acetyltransferase [Calditrichaeota bacterium]|nr:MAG: N-acetyltransferase [Calditrichota bacterium]